MNDKQFEEVCHALEEGAVVNPRMLSVFEFQSKIIFLQKKAEKLNSKL